MHLYSYIQTSSKIQEFIDWNLHVSQETEARYEFSICNSGDELECRKCSPISLLPNFNRLIEKMMYKKEKAFFTKFDVLCSSQYWWFQGSYTIEYTLLHIVIKIKTNMDASFLIDLKKTFDTVDNELFFHKVNHFGIRGVISNWLRSVLSGHVRQHKQVKRFRKRKSR